MQVYPLRRAAHTDVERALLAGQPLEGWCPVCGELTRFVDATENLRESCFCERCRANNRQRQMAFVLLRVLEQMRGVSLLSLADLVALNPPVGVYNTEASGPVHAKLSVLPTYICSEYFGPQHASGDRINGVMHQDLMRCSLADASQDIVLSSDVFEHIPDPYAAHAELFRILKRGGRHLFTVPFQWDRWLDERRASLGADGSIQHFLPPEVHGDPVRPDEGALVFMKPSLEMCVRLAELEYDVRIYRPYVPWCGIVDLALVFEAIKPLSTESVGAGS